MARSIRGWARWVQRSGHVTVEPQAHLYWGSDVSACGQREWSGDLEPGIDGSDPSPDICEDCRQYYLAHRNEL